MRTVITALTLLISMAAASAGQQARPGARPEDEAAIRKIVSRLQDGWNAGDGKAFASPFAVDADYVIINGARIKGRDAIDSGHQRIFDTIYKNSNNTASLQSIRFIRDDIAVAHVEWHLRFSENGTAREGTAMNSLVLARDGGQWSIVAFQNTSVASARR
ncbi:MAG TPA: SgcJ/EcaC family oxidoreductase [Blastocatellia bacterium]|nr:SgcJ/EcaC family oxidoreductase [Blastocatellia bacterium]